MKTVEEALNEYKKCFGENYPLCVTDCKSNEEVIAEVKNCIKTEEKASPPVYEDDTEY